MAQPSHEGDELAANEKLGATTLVSAAAEQPPIPAPIPHKPKQSNKRRLPALKDVAGPIQRPKLTADRHIKALYDEITVIEPRLVANITTEHLALSPRSLATKTRELDVDALAAVQEADALLAVVSSRVRPGLLSAAAAMSANPAAASAKARPVPALQQRRTKLEKQR